MGINESRKIARLSAKADKPGGQESRKFSILLSLLLICLVSFSQEIKKSEQTVVVDGKIYCLHTVEQSQTLYGIAKAYGVSVSDILRINPETIDGLKPDQVIKVPCSEVPLPGENDKNGDPKVSSKYKMYKVEKGDTWYSVAKKFKINADQLQALNPETKSLKAGQEIRIPSLAFSKDDQIPKDQQTLNTTVTEPKPNKPDSLHKKSEYNVAFLLPLDLGVTDYIDPEKIRKGSQDFPEKSKFSLEFYQGVKLALDSLKIKGLKVNAWFYDMADSSSSGHLIKNPEFKKMDLIVGPFYSSSFSEIAKFAKQNGIALVSPTLQNNKILLGNPNVFKVMPSVYTQLDQMGKFVGKSYGEENILLVSSGGPKDATLLKVFKDNANAVLKENGKDSVKVVTGLSGAVNAIVKGKINVIILPSTNQSYVTDFLSKLYKVRYERKDSIVLFGMNAWADYDNLDIAYLNDMSFHYPSRTFVNYSDSAVKRLFLKYRQTYNTEPSEFVLDGFDISWYFINMLSQYGTNFPSYLHTTGQNGVMDRFDFRTSGVDSGFENNGVFFLRYRNFILERAN